jgi:hypothetical protein
MDGPMLTSRPIQDMSSARPEIHLGLAPTNGSKSWQSAQVYAHIYVKRQLTKCHAKDLRNSRKEKSLEYLMSTSLTIITPPFRTVKAGEPYEVIFFP